MSIRKTLPTAGTQLSSSISGIKVNLSRIRASLVPSKQLAPPKTYEIEEDFDGTPTTSVEDIRPKREYDSFLGSGTPSMEESSASNVVEYEAKTQHVSFFLELGIIPSIADIQLSTDEEETSLNNIRITKSEALETDPTDEGRFVDPLTGEVISSTSTESVAYVEAAEETVEEEEDDFDLDDDELLLEPDLMEEPDLKEEPKDDMVMWMDLQPDTTVHIAESIDFEKIRREEETRVVLENTKQFLGELIDHIVGRCEYVDPKQVLRKQLNKKVLMSELANLLEQLETEQRGQNFLNRKVVEHFRRKKSFRAIIDDSPDKILKNMEQYKNTRTKLDRLLSCENDIKKVASEKKNFLSREIDTMELNFRHQLISLEEMIKKAMHRETAGTLQTEVVSELRSMSELRNEITKVRCTLIQQQHSLANLIEQSEKLDDLGEGLKLTTFETLANQTQALEKKNEERTSDLLKLHRRFSANLHTRGHLREKFACLSQSVNIQEGVLHELKQHHVICRKNLLAAKLKRSHLVHEMREKSFEGGLLDKPLLMIDYDETVERVQKMRNKVQNLRQKHTDMQNRIDLMENERKCNLNVK